MEKNLFDIGDIIKKEIQFIQTKEDCTIKTAEMNKFTIDFLKSKGIYGIKSIPIIQNNNLMNYEIKFNREKNSKPTEYEPYKIPDQS